MNIASPSSGLTKEKLKNLIDYSNLRSVTDSKNLFIGQYDKFFEEYWLSPIV
jgi:hypothetical protein